MTQACHVAWIGLGGNLNNPECHIRQALDELASTPGLRLLAVSRLYRTAPVGGPAGQPDFCNACAAISCDVTPLVLLQRLQTIEAAHGRLRTVRWGARTLDLDMLAYDDVRMTHARLCLPHPRATRRAFVLVPLAEIAPALVLDGCRVIDCVRALDTTGVGLWQ